MSSLSPVALASYFRSLAAIVDDDDGAVMRPLRGKLPALAHWTSTGPLASPNFISASFSLYFEELVPMCICVSG